MDIQQVLLAGVGMNQLQHMSIAHLVQMVLLYLLVQIFTLVKTEGIPIVKKWVNAHLERGKNKVLSMNSPRNTQPTSQIIFTRNYELSDKDQDVIDSIIAYLCTIDSVVKLQYTCFYTVVSLKEFPITDDIYGRVQRIDRGSNDDIHIFEFVICSYTLSLHELKEWVDNVYEQYVLNRGNQLKNKKHYFDQFAYTETDIIFNMTPFSTYKSLSNLYGPQITHIRERVSKFKDIQWYKAHGIPHTIGFLLKGAPGTGKTSTIKAIANELKRHILNVRLTSDMTIETVKKLFFSNMIRVKDMDGNIRNITVPCNERIYVMEDIDCLTDIVLDRKYKPIETIEVIPTAEHAKNKELYEKQKKEKQINLSVLLNLLDGILETPGRVLVFTSNFPERLDSALLRPGRIDALIEFTHCDVDTLYEMCTSFYSVDDVNRNVLAQFDGLFSPAVVQEKIICSDTFDVLCEKLTFLASSETTSTTN
jgi:hypothetical protein